ncbi:MAG: phage scaffolding protein [Anaerovoracaceae bacterium]
MKKEEFIALGVDEETAKKLEEASLKELKEFVPIGRLNEKISEVKQLEADVKSRDKQLEELKKVDPKELEAKIETLQTENKTQKEKYDEELKQTRIDNAVSLELTKAKALNSKTVVPLIDMSKIAMSEDGTITGLTEQIEGLRKGDETKFLFGAETKPAGTEPAGGSGGPMKITQEQFDGMTYSQKVELYNKDVNLFNSLSGASDE